MTIGTREPAAYTRRVRVIDYLFLVVGFPCFGIVLLMMSHGPLLPRLLLPTFVTLAAVTITVTVPWEVAVTKDAIRATFLPWGGTVRLWTKQNIAIRIGAFGSTEPGAAFKKRVWLIPGSTWRRLLPVYLSGGPFGRFDRHPDKLIRALRDCGYQFSSDPS